MSPSRWVFSATPENWKIARDRKVWAVQKRSVSEKVRRGDFIILYVLGTGCFCTVMELVSDWAPATKALWADEVQTGEVKYRYQSTVRIVQEGLAHLKELLPQLGFIKNKRIWGMYFRGTPANMGRPITEVDYELIYETMKSTPLPADMGNFFKAKPKVTRKEAQPGLHPSSVPRHNEIRDMILEIGKIEGKIAEVEYSIDNLRLDVVWKTITSGNPKWAFEVQMAGNFYEALTKLKHAWDKWNSKPFLVTTDTYVSQAKSLLEGSFHEMRDDARIVNYERIVKLHQLLKEAHKIRSEIRF